MNDCTTYPTKLIENLRKEIEDLKREIFKLKIRVHNPENKTGHLDNY